MNNYSLKQGYSGSTIYSIASHTVFENDFGCIGYGVFTQPRPKADWEIAGAPVALIPTLIRDRKLCDNSEKLGGMISPISGVTCD